MQNKPLINLLIRHGCLGYLEPPKRGDSVASTLLMDKDIESLKLLISAGYPIHKDTEELSRKLSLITNQEIFHFVHCQLENPLSLKQLCRTVIRTSLGHTRIQDKLSKLSISQRGPLPEIIVKYLKLETVQDFQFHITTIF